jgi:hypothetical protein
MNVTIINNTNLTTNLTENFRDLEFKLEISTLGYVIGLVLMILSNAFPFIYLRYKKYKANTVNHPI